MAEIPIIIEDCFSNWDRHVGKTVLRRTSSSGGFVVSTSAIKLSPRTEVSDFETIVFDFLGYEMDELSSTPQPIINGDNENFHLGLNKKFFERNGASVESARNHHYDCVEKLAVILEAGEPKTI